MAWRSTFRVWHRDRCLGVVWKSALGHGFAVGCVGSDRRGFLLVARGNVERELFFDNWFLQVVFIF